MEDLELPDIDSMDPDEAVSALSDAINDLNDRLSADGTDEQSIGMYINVVTELREAVETQRRMLEEARKHESEHEIATNIIEVLEEDEGPQDTSG